MSFLLAAGADPSLCALADVEGALRRIHVDNAAIRAAQTPSLAIGLIESPDTSVCDFAETSPGSNDGDIAVVMGYSDLGSRTLSPGNGRTLLLDAWRRLGSAFLRDLDGSFAIVLHDASHGRTLVATDCFSSRTLWIHSTDSSVAISSNVRLLPLVRGFRPTLDPAYLWSFLNHASTVDDRSPFEEVRAIKPAEAVVLERGRITERLEYVRPVFAGRDRPSRDIAEELVHVLRTNVTRCINTSQSPCLFLSGGLDSRLLAALCPPGTSALTLADSENRETAIASRVAIVAGLTHRVLLRDPSWYPDVLEEASIGSNGIWSWNEAHYLPLRQSRHDFVHDAAILGFGSNTYFRGNHLSWDRLWDPAPAGQDLPSRLLELVMTTPQAAKQGPSSLNQRAVVRCRDAYREVARARLDGLASCSDRVGDLWELFWSAGMTTVVQAYNLSCLRTFLRECNAFGGRPVQSLYLATTPEQRARGTIIRDSLRQLGPVFSRIPDANTWLPAHFPAWTHQTTFRARLLIARLRAEMLRRQKSRDFRSRGSWPHAGLLWLSSHQLQRHISSLIGDEAAFPREYFDHAALRDIWSSHLSRRHSYATELNVLATFGIFFRSFST